MVLNVVYNQARHASYLCACKYRKNRRRICFCQRGQRSRRTKTCVAARFGTGTRNVPRPRCVRPFRRAAVPGVAGSGLVADCPTLFEHEFVPLFSCATCFIKTLFHTCSRCGYRMCEDHDHSFQETVKLLCGVLCGVMSSLIPHAQYAEAHEGPPQVRGVVFLVWRAVWGVCGQYFENRKLHPRRG